MTPSDQTNNPVTMGPYSAMFRLSDNPADTVWCRVDKGDLLVTDVNGAPLVRLAGPSSTGVATWQFEWLGGIVRDSEHFQRFIGATR